MKDISHHMTEAYRHMRQVDDSIAFATMSPKDHAKARNAAIMARYEIERALLWLAEHEPN